MRNTACFIFIVFVWVLNLSWLACLAQSNSGSDAERSLEVGAETRSYLLHVPPARNAAMPLVLVFHGGGGKASGMKGMTGMDRVADQFGFVAVYPEGANRVWCDGGSNLGEGSPHDDVAFVRRLIKDVASQVPIDEHRVFACGFSNGGSMTARLVLEASDIIKAGAMVDGGLYVKHRDQYPHPKPMPVLIIQGTDDPCFPYKGGETHGPKIGGIFQGQPHGNSLSTDEALSFWCRVNHCPAAPQTKQIPHVTQDNTSTTYKLFPGADGNDVAAYIVSGGGHCWPGGTQYFPISVIGKTTYDFSASEAIWQFFAHHSHLSRN